MTVHTVEVVPGKIGERLENCEIIEVLRVRGICEEWRVYAPVEGDDEFFVLHAPTDGPMQIFKEFSKSTQTCRAFPFNRDRSDNYHAAWKDATDYAMGEASAAILAETTGIFPVTP